MSDRIETSPCQAPDGVQDLASAYCAVNYHFGLLLGVEEFTTEQLYHRGKIRLHNAWLHREGVVWGLDVHLDTSKGEIRVRRGLAVDSTGREIHLDSDQCLSVGAWYEANKDKLRKAGAAGDAPFVFDAYVAIRFKACLTRPVPAISEPCDGAGSDTACSRIFESAEVLLVPGRAPSPRYPYHRLRLLAGIDTPKVTDGVIDPDDMAVIDERTRILSLPPQERTQALLKAFRRFAARDEISLEPITSADGSYVSPFPGDATQGVPLAQIVNLKVEMRDGHWVGTGGEVDVDVRPVHVATSTIQELLCGLPLCSAAPARAGGGPAVDRGSVVVGSKDITFKVDSALDLGSVKAEAFAVEWYDASGWHPVTASGADFDPATLTVKVTLAKKLDGKLVRFIARGTGERPLLGANMVPLGGMMSASASSERGGGDFVYMDERR